MAEQIIQTLGFDAGQAISNIGRLNGALVGMTNNLLAASNAAKTFNGQNVSKSLGKITSGAKGAEAALGRVAKRTNGINNVAKSLNNAQKSSAGFALSLQTLSRIAVAQGIVRGLNIIFGELRQAVTKAVDFNLALSEAAAISPRGVTNFADEVDRLGSELIETSNSFGFDVLDLAEAKYQEFSNQVKGSADSNKLFIESNKLARISASSVGEAVGALSSVLNSYDQSVESADKVSAALFKTVELGRVRLRDIADQLGNVTPLARSAGISFNELGASIATITRSGVSASRSLTQVRALINQLQKPPEALKALFQDVFQVSGIEEAIQKFGSFQGVIEAVADEAGGSTAKIAQFFTNIRARNAFISLTSQSENFTNALNEISEASENATTFIGDLLAEFDAQDAVKFEKALQELKNTFLELAQEALPTITSGLGLLTSAIDNVGSTAAAVAAGGLAIYSVKLIRLAAITTNVAAASKLASTGIVGIGFAAGIALGFLLEFLDQKNALAGLAEAFEDFDQIELKQLKQIALDAAQTRKEFAATTKEGTKLFNTLATEAKKSLEPIRAANDSFVATIDSTLKDLISSREKFVKALESQVSGLESRVSKRTEEGASIREEIADNEFDRRQRNLNNLQKAFSQQERAEKALNRVQGDTSSLKGLDERAKGLERVKTLTEQSVAAAEASGSRAALFNAEKLLSKVLNEQLSLKQQANALDKEAAAQAATRLAGERKKLEDLKAASKDLLSSLSAFNEDGSLKTADQRQQDQVSAQEALGRVQRLKFEADDFDFGALVGLESLQQRVNDLTGDITPQFEGIQEGFNAAIEALSTQRTITVDVNLLVNQARDLGIDVDDVDPGDRGAAVADVFKQATAEAERLRSTSEELTRLSAQRATNTEKLVELLNRAEASSRDQIKLEESVPSGDVDAALEPIVQLRSDVEQLLSQPITTDILDQIIAKFEKINELGDLPGTPIFGGEAAFLEKVNEQLRTRLELDSQLASGGGNEARLAATQALADQALQSGQELLGVQTNLATAINSSKTSQEGFNSEQSQSVTLVSGITGGYDAANSSLTSLIAKQKELNAAQAAGGGGATPRMFGGPLFRAFGGFASRGTDTIPAMLSDGESVINARSSRRFASQINAINAGVTPVFRQEGGVVNNAVNIGDINVNGTSDPDTTARRVMSQIRREQRRGTSSSFKK